MSFLKETKGVVKKWRLFGSLEEQGPFGHPPQAGRRTV
jgi:hypothetical protein